MNIKAEYLVGKQKNNEWAGVYGYRPESDTDKSKAEMFAVTRIQTDAEVDNLERVAKMLLDELQQNFYSDEESKDEILRIEHAFNKMKAKLEVILSREEEIQEKGLDIEIAAAFLLDDVLYVGVVGESKVFIFRNDKFVDITRALVDANMSGFIKTGSLKVQDDDIFCLATSKVAADSEALQNGVSKLNTELMAELKDIEGSAILLFADESLQWNKTVEFQDEKMTEEASIDQTVEEEKDFSSQDFAPEFSEDNQEVQQLSPVVGAVPNTPIGDNNIVENENKFSEFNEEENSEDEGEYIETEENADLSGRSQMANKLTNQVGNIKTKLFSIFSNVKTKGSNFADNSDTGSKKTYIKIISDIITWIKNGITSLINMFKREILGQGIDRTNRVLYQNKLQRNRKILFIVLVIAVIFIYIGLKDAESRRIEAERIDNARTELTQLQNDFAPLNSQVETVKTQAQAKKDILISSLDNIINEAESQKSTGLLTNDLNDLITQANQAKDNVQLIKEVNSENIQVISDIGKVHADSEPTGIVFTNGNIFVSDNKRGVIYKITPNVNSDPTEFVKNLTSPNVLTKNSAGDIIFYDSDSSTAIAKVNPKSGEVYRFPYLSTGVIGTITKAAVYSGNDALYEIHQDHQQIFKRDKDGQNYFGGGAIYSTVNPPNWKTDPEFSKAIDIAAPYEIYVLIQGGGLRRYLAGGDNSLTYDTFSNFAQSDYNAINDATAIDVDGKYLAVADPKNKRVLVFEIQDNDQKNLRFTKQFVYRGDDNTFSNITELAVSEANNEVFVLDGTKVVKLNL